MESGRGTQCGSRPNLAQHAAWLAEYADLGFDDIYLHHVGQEQERFIDIFADRVLPQAVRGRGAEPCMRITDTSDVWWKTAVVYCLDIETFYDLDGDGVGDLRGPGRAHRLPRRARHHVPVADAVLPHSRPG